MHDFGEEFGTYALRHWVHAPSNSSLHLAVSAFSLAVFGQARHVDQALVDADKFYARSVVKTRREVEQLSNETVDQLLATTALMASYDVRHR